ncbi:MAG TPA: LemA family protein [Candidatus Stercorousia faecigallinarum]|nr:LemA family protein [Candidatus Stercorousia faecigallinarum]
MEILLVAAAIVVIGPYLIYVQLIKKKNKVKEAEGSVDVQLKKRYDLIPNILTIAKKFMEHERSLIEDITKLRTQAAKANEMSEKIKLDNAIKGKMEQLMINVENYPQLKSDATMVQAMQTYAEVEEHIAAARRFYNSAVNELNNAVEIFPSSVIAGMLNIKAKPFFEVQENERRPINASDIL